MLPYGVIFLLLSVFAALWPGNKVLGLIPAPCVGSDGECVPCGLSGGNSQCLVGQSPENGDGATLGIMDIFQVNQLLMRLFSEENQQETSVAFMSLLSRK